MEEQTRQWSSYLPFRSSVSTIFVRERRSAVMLSAFFQGACRMFRVIFGGDRNHARRCVVDAFISLSMSIGIQIKDASCVQKSLHLIEGCSVLTCQRHCSLMVTLVFLMIQGQLLTLIGRSYGWSDSRR